MRKGRVSSPGRATAGRSAGGAAAGRSGGFGADPPGPRAAAGRREPERAAVVFRVTLRRALWLLRAPRFAASFLRAAPLRRAPVLPADFRRTGPPTRRAALERPVLREALRLRAAFFLRRTFEAGARPAGLRARLREVFFRAAIVIPPRQRPHASRAQRGFYAARDSRVNAHREAEPGEGWS